MEEVQLCCYPLTLVMVNTAESLYLYSFHFMVIIPCEHPLTILKSILSPFHRIPRFNNYDIIRENVDITVKPEKTRTRHFVSSNNVPYNAMQIDVWSQNTVFNQMTAILALPTILNYAIMKIIMQDTLCGYNESP